MTSKEITDKQFVSLIEDAVVMEELAAKEAGTLGYMARVLTQATIPHSRYKGNEFTRTNGNFMLTMLAPSDVGLPWGSMPRLLLAWITTEAVRTKSPNLVLGTSLTGFMRELGLYSTGGRWGTNTRLRTSMLSLFSTSISCKYTGKKADFNHDVGHSLLVADDYDIWWSPKEPNQSALWGSVVNLSLPFFKEITTKPVPIDLRVIKVLKGSPMALDIYIWLTYRMSYLIKPTVIPWPLLQMQFGAEYENTRQGRYNFKKSFFKHLKKVHLFYSNANIEEDNKGKGLLLKQSIPHVPKLSSK